MDRWRRRIDSNGLVFLFYYTKMYNVQYLSKPLQRSQVKPFKTLTFPYFFLKYLDINVQNNMADSTVPFASRASTL